MTTLVLIGPHAAGKSTLGARSPRASASRSTVSWGSACSSTLRRA